jgi:hypothetical protein
MKKLILLGLLTLAVATGFAQTGSAVKLPLKVGDTIINTGTTTRVLKFTGAYSGANLQINVALVSGTGSGTLTLQGSLDGVNYKTIGSAYTITNTALQAPQFNILAPLPTFLRIQGVGSGTEVAVLTYWYNNPLF